MKQLKKIVGFNIIFIISCLAQVTSANASGFIFDWQPFVVDAGLSLKNHNSEVFIKNSSIADISAFIREDSRYAFYPVSDQNNTSAPESQKKSMLENIQINLFQPGASVANSRETHKYSDDEKISKFVDAMTSLIYDDSKIKSLETIGKTIEPQINFYFKF
ncbi:MAG TPA: hypothetical protein VMU29_06885 [Smithella sp.]|nr:hypothetical protein [Smithella sp.]